MTEPRVVVVVKRSLYGRYVEDEADPRVRLLLRRRDPTVARWRPAHDEHMRTVEAVEERLRRLGAHVLWVRPPSAQFDATDSVLVLTVGGDGTLLAASHAVRSVPILAVNSAPRFSVGSYCAANRQNLDRLLPAALEGKLGGARLARMRVAVDGRTRSRRVLNEVLFCHACPAATCRYILSCRGRQEEQRSSGFWIGTAAGSTAAQRSAGGRVLPLGSRHLQLVVREPYEPPGHRCRLRRLSVGPGEIVTAKSKMHEGYLFLDGPYLRVPVRLGEVVTFSADGDPLQVLGLHGRAG